MSLNRFEGLSLSYVARFWENPKIFIITCAILYIVRAFVAFYSGYHGTDIIEHLIASRGILQGQLLYADLRFDYTPLHAYLQAFFLIFLGDHAFAAKMPALLGDLALAGALYVVGQLKDIRLGRQLTLLYLCFPLSVITSDILGLFDSVALFLMILGIYFILKQEDGISAFSFGLGGMYKFIPFLALIPIFIGYLLKGDAKKMVTYILIIGITTTITVVPYLFLNYGAALHYILFNSTKFPDSFSIFRIIPVYSTSWPFILQFALLAAIYGFALKWGKINIRSFEGITLFIVLFMLLNKNFYPQYFLWIFPFFAYWFLAHQMPLRIAGIFLIDSVLLSLYWVDYGNLVNSSIILPLIFHLINWGIIGYILCYERNQSVSLSRKPLTPSNYGDSNKY